MVDLKYLSGDEVIAAETYTRPPVTEAVIDVRVQYDEGRDIDALRPLADSLRASYPTQQPTRVVGMAFEAKDEAIQQRPTVHKAVGWKLVSADSSRILQIEKRMFAYSHLPPYSNWRQFSSEGRELFAKYVDVWRPAMVTRIAVRYINRIVFPFGRIALEDYFAVRPEFPDSLGPMGGVVLQLQVFPDGRLDDLPALITMASQPSEGEEVVFVLDIDVYREKEMELDVDAVFSELERARMTKNRIFEACLTERAKDMFR